MLEKVDKNHTARDTLLRNELDQMAARLEKGHEELTALIGRVVSAMDPTAAAPPGIGLGAIDERVRILGERVDAQLAQMGRATNTMETGWALRR